MAEAKRKNATLLLKAGATIYSTVYSWKMVKTCQMVETSRLSLEGDWGREKEGVGVEWKPHLIHVLLGPAPEGPKTVALAALTHKA